jgi:hypothetical protein
MKTLKSFALTAALFASAAQAQVIDFNELAHNDDYYGHQSVMADGFLFTNSQAGDHALGVWGRNSAFQADPGGASVFVNYGQTTTTMTRQSNDSFDFVSIDLADVYNGGNSSTIQFTFNFLAGGSLVESVTLDSLPGLQTFAFNQVGLSSVSWMTAMGDGGWNQFDNVNVGMAQPVPEPETYALMLAGLGMVAWMTRRRRQERN